MYFLENFWGFRQGLLWINLWNVWKTAEAVKSKITVFCIYVNLILRILYPWRNTGKNFEKIGFLS